MGDFIIYKKRYSCTGKAAVCGPEREFSPGTKLALTLILDLSASRTRRKYLVCGILLWQPELAKTQFCFQGKIGIGLNSFICTHTHTHTHTQNGIGEVS